MNDPCDSVDNTESVNNTVNCEAHAEATVGDLSVGDLSDEQVQRIAKAMADPQRFAILECIAAQPEMPCKTLVAEFPITQATISHHLKELVAADLIRSRRDGQMAILSCRRDVCRAYTRRLAQRLADEPRS